jgi:hypothetical protein
MLTPDQEFERRLRVLLEPNQEIVARVRASALRVESPRRTRTSTYALASVVALLVVVAAIGLRRRERAAAQTQVFTAEFSGDLVVLRAPDGSVTLRGRSTGTPAVPAGSFRIVYEGRNQ